MISRRAAQDVRLERDGKILWYFPVGDRSVYADDLKFYEVEHMAAQFPDPYRFNTFGNLLESPALTLKDGALRGTGKSFDIRIHALAMQTPKAETWIETIERQAAQPVDAARDWEKHCAWWADFWERSWIVASDRTLPPEAREKFNGEPSAAGVREEEDGAALVAQSYNVFRFLMACQSRGRIQTKFNGGLFTQQLRVQANAKRTRPDAVEQPDGTWLTHEDDRLWGRRFTYQNQRLLYWPLLASGDFDLMKPFFDYYWNLLPMRQAITKAWFGHDGAYYRENIEPTGAERDCGKDGRPPKTKPGEKYEGWYHDYYFTSGLETTGDDARLRQLHRRRGVSRPRAGALRAGGPAVLRPALSARRRRQAPPRAGPGDRDLVDRGQPGAGRRGPAVLPGRIAGDESRHGGRPGPLAEVPRRDSRGVPADHRRPPGHCARREMGEEAATPRTANSTRSFPSAVSAWRSGAATSWLGR